MSINQCLDLSQRHKYLKCRLESVTIDDGLTLPDLTTNSMVQTDASGKLETVQQVYYDNSLAALVSTTAIQCNNCKITSQL